MVSARIVKRSYADQSIRGYISEVIISIALLKYMLREFKCVKNQFFYTSLADMLGKWDMQGGV